MQMAKKHKIKVRAYISTCFGCPYEGKIAESKVISLAKKVIALGAYEVSIGDTIGVATPKQVHSLLPKLIKAVGRKKIALHFHDTRGMALANIAVSLDHGIQTFDTSIAGLGGCPYAPGASGNVATENVVYMLERMGYNTGIDIEKLIQASRWITQSMNRPPRSQLSQTTPWFPG
jgi:hydroxymethylglutaryl-CoA lyase